jgi:DNA modification methylase
MITQGVWDKGVQGLGGDFCNTYEIWGVFGKGDPHTIHPMIKNVINFQRLNGVRPDHPHAKPKEVIKKLINYTTQKNDLVLDCFAGTGSTATSCIELDRRYYCIELEQDYVSKALTKIKRYTEEPEFAYGGTTT